MTVIALEGVTKTYSDGGIHAVADLHLTVPEGVVFGFLGRNGAGKTTTMRMLVGLVRPTSGKVTVLGEAPGTPSALARIGALIEQPTFYPHLSGADNLRLVARYAGLPDSSVDGVLDEVGLTGRAGHRIRGYSLGMKQRLGVAAALLKDPELLILDEPTNGLDPAGVTDIRALLRAQRDRGRTVLLSSHVLSEVEQVCDRIAVIDAGRLVAEDTPDHLRASFGADALLIDASPAEAAVSVLRGHPGVQAVSIDGGTVRVTADPSLAADLNRLLVSAGVDVSGLRRGRHSLEEAFLELTSPSPAATLSPAESTLEGVR